MIANEKFGSDAALRKLSGGAGKVVFLAVVCRLFVDLLHRTMELGLSMPGAGKQKRGP